MNVEEHDKDFTIVVVDDSEDVRTTINAFLTSEGYNVVGLAESASAAGHIPGFFDMKLFIIDIVMPEANGMELSKIISKRDSEHYIVMLSNLPLKNIIIEAITNGAKDIIEKPFSKKRLLKSVKKMEQQYKIQHETKKKRTSV